GMPVADGRRLGADLDPVLDRDAAGDAQLGMLDVGTEEAGRLLDGGGHFVCLLGARGWWVGAGSRRRRRVAPGAPTGLRPGGRGPAGGGQAGTTTASARAARSSLREASPSFPYTLRRCHSTVRPLRNSWPPISAFVRPSAARWAICASCGV